MKQRSGSSKRTAQQLPESLHRQLNAYALAASAAGVGMLALAQPAEGRIIYTSADTKILVNTYAVHLDLNHDGISDFLFYNMSATGGGKRLVSHYGFLIVRPTQQSNRVWATKSGNFGLLCAAALPKGVRVGPRDPFQPGYSSLIMDAFSEADHSSACPWHGNHRAYLGLKFFIKGRTHFGWARLTVHGTVASEAATLTGYAYETVPNKPIITGKTKGPGVITVQPATLGHLAAGATAIPAWRATEG